jgi:D-glycero-D-manno-heptose 1,7-bisphosphate phosphatase
LVEAPHRIYLAESPVRGCPGLFLDRDGTLIEDSGYIADPDEVRPLPGVGAVLGRFRAAGYALVVVTNQSGIGRGLYSWTDYDAVAARIEVLFGAQGVVFDAVLACGHSPETDPPCEWRKPAPGMIREAAKLLSLDLSRSLLVGDKLADLEAAAAAGLSRAVHVASGHGAAARADVVGWRCAITVDLVDDLSTLSP